MIAWLPVLCLVAAHAPPVPAATGPVPGGWLTEQVAMRVRRNPPLGAVPADPTNRFADSDAAAQLGRRIFFDARFSASGTVRCASCHDPAHGFADARPVAVGEGVGSRRSMSILNAAHQRWLTWDGRADTLWSQALQPLETPHEMGFSRRQALALVASDAALRDAYRAAFGAEPPVPAAGNLSDVDAAFANLGKAIAAYERHLVSGPSAYDRWWTARAAGDPAADAILTDAERRGLALFFGSANCFQCHHGALFSDGEFHMIGIPPRDGGVPKDPGRYAVVDRVRSDPFNAAGPHSDDPHGPAARISASLVNSPDHWGEFRTPSLRGVAERPPYMHAGQLASLADVVRFYSTLEGATSLDHHRELVLRRLDLSAAEQSDLAAFLGALTGAPPPAPWCAAPDGPPAAVPSGAAAPGPEPGFPSPARNASPASR
jgi:cytochrome c peroxidase